MVFNQTNATHGSAPVSPTVLLDTRPSERNMALENRARAVCVGVIVTRKGTRPAVGNATLTRFAFYKTRNETP